jgi:hypothetical protein
MKTLLLTGIAALFLATGVAQSTPLTGTAHAYDKYSAPLKDRFGVTGACVVSDKDVPSVFMRQHPKGSPEGLR